MLVWDTEWYWSWTMDIPYILIANFRGFFATVITVNYYNSFVNKYHD